MMTMTEYTITSAETFGALTLPQVDHFEPTGSRHICNPPVLDTDEDWVVLVSSNLEAYLQQLQEKGWSHPQVYDDDMREFFSIRKGDVNLIVTAKPEFYHRFVAATRAAKQLNLTKKSDRVDLFQAVLYGNYTTQA